MAQTHVGSDSPLASKVTSAGMTARKRNRTGKTRTHTYQGKYAKPLPRNEHGQMTGRKYGPGKDMDDELDALPQANAAHINLDTLDDVSLDQFAVRNFGRRFPGNMPRSEKMTELRKEFDPRRPDRYA